MELTYECPGCGRVDRVSPGRRRPRRSPARSAARPASCRREAVDGRRSLRRSCPCVRDGGPVPPEGLPAGARAGDRGRRVRGQHGLLVLRRPVPALLVLLASAALDMVLFYVVPDVTICYRCLSQYRGAGANPGGRFAPFDLAVGERYRQERLRVEELRAGRRPPGDAGPLNARSDAPPLPSRSPSPTVDERRARIHDDLRGLIAASCCSSRSSAPPYALDASLYEIDPLGVVVPRTEDDLVAAVRYAAENAIPLHARGAGTAWRARASGRAWSSTSAATSAGSSRSGPRRVVVQAGGGPRRPERPARPAGPADRPRPERVGVLHHRRDDRRRTPPGPAR